MLLKGGLRAGYRIMSQLTALAGATANSKLTAVIPIAIGVLPDEMDPLDASLEDLQHHGPIGWDTGDTPGSTNVVIAFKLPGEGYVMIPAADLPSPITADNISAVQAMIDSVI